MPNVFVCKGLKHGGQRGQESRLTACIARNPAKTEAEGRKHGFPGQKENIPGSYDPGCLKHLRRDSNPCFRLERAAS